MIASRLRFESSHATQFVDITDRIRDEVRKSGLATGRVHLQSLHTTLGLAINENEPLLLRDFQTLLERLAPGDAPYQHDDFARRMDVATDEPINGHAHCRQLLLTGFTTLLVEDGELVLGRWQSVFAVELDGPRHRELAMQLDGDFAIPSPFMGEGQGQAFPSAFTGEGQGQAFPSPFMGEGQGGDGHESALPAPFMGEGQGGDGHESALPAPFMGEGHGQAFPSPFMGEGQGGDGQLSVSHNAQKRDLLELEITRQLMVDPDPVAAPMRRLMEAGGKRLRPKLVQLTAQLGPRYDPLRTAGLAAAIELLHNATLVHDDYVDESTHRRGRPTIAAEEGAERAIAVGDYYFAKATRLIAETGNHDVTQTIAAALEAICESQIDDVALRGAFPGDHDSYLRVVRGKTAALFSAACASGAQLSKASPDVVEALRRYGDLLGTAFQMADDMVDFSPSSGKPVGLDIRQRVLSLPLIYAAEDREVGPEVRKLLAGTLGDAEVARVAELVASSKALRRVGDEARGLVEEAVGVLEAIELNGLRPTLIGLARSAVDRDS